MPKDFVSQKELLQKVRDFIHRYLSVSESFEKLASYYVLFSWVHDDFNELPYLRAIGEYGSGKSRFLKVVGSICYRPIFVGSSSPAAIFRIINDFKGTVIWDEADFGKSDTTAEIIKILNNGFSKGGSVLRCESPNGKNFDVRAFCVFGPKVIATRFLYDDAALESRMITEDMNFNKVRPDVSLNTPAVFDEEALELRNQLLSYRFQNKGKFTLHAEYENREIESRLNQISVPLMSIIEDADDITEVQKYFLTYNNKMLANRTESRRYQILEAICVLIDSGFIEPTLKQISQEFNSEGGYSEYISSRKMGHLIRSMFDLKTERDRHGYRLTRDNKDKIELLRQSMKIPRKGDSECVNDVNNTLGDEYKDIAVVRTGL
jgi:hypothetical protein